MAFLAGLSSIFVGILIGAAGVGGVLLIPVLIFLAGLPTHEAMATALFSFFFTGIMATYAFQKRGSIDWGLTVPVCLGSLISSYAGAAVGALASAMALNLLLSAIIIVSTLYPMLPMGRSHLASTLGRRGNFLLLLGIGLFTGFFCGMTGAGGGILSLPLMLVFGYPALPAIATGQVLQSIVSLSGSFSNYGNGFIDFGTAWWVTICEVVGVVIGVRILHAIPVGIVKKGVTWVCLALGVFIGAYALFQ